MLFDQDGAFRTSILIRSLLFIETLSPR